MIDEHDLDDTPSGPVDLKWMWACDDCLDGNHIRCRRRRHCACKHCDWRKRTAADAPTPKPKPKPKGNPKAARIPKEHPGIGLLMPVRQVNYTTRPGKLSENGEYKPVNDEVCLQAAQMLTKRWNLSEVARQLGVERSNLYRAMKRRGLR